MLFFNTTGPVKQKKHYSLPPLKRFDLDEIEMLFAQEKYFVLHAPRQTGKTTCMLALTDYLNKKGDYKCLYCNVEAAQGAREDVYKGIKTILAEMAQQAKLFIKDNFLSENCFDVLRQVGENYALNESLTSWANNDNKPLIIIIDEINSLVGDTLISVLRQLRSGYHKRPEHFPVSIILCGVRDIRDYRIHSSRGKEIITGGSAFNIKAASLRLGDFTKKETFALLKQHEEQTGQIIEQNALNTIWHYSRGQPWLVNALAYETCFAMKPNRDRKKLITEEMIHQAKENLILRRETHLDQLGDKLKEERVRKVIEPILTGKPHVDDIPDDDILYVEDLGLITREKGLGIANPVYAEIIPRQLTYSTQRTMTQETAWYINPDKTLNMQKLITAFQEFFREHSQHWLERFQYKEAGPQLLLQAFLQRIINSGGRVEREYGQGRRRVDLLVLWTRATETQKIVIELKILYKSLEKTIAEGLEQTADYMDLSNADEGHLIIFNRNDNISWHDKIFIKETPFKDKIIIIWGM